MVSRPPSGGWLLDATGGPRRHARIGGGMGSVGGGSGIGSGGGEEGGIGSGGGSGVGGCGIGITADLSIEEERMPVEFSIT